MAAPRLIISDIDGTLLDDGGDLPDLNRRALAHCRARGVRTCLATGRRWTTCRRLLDRLDLYGLLDYCILNNGMIVRDLARDQAIYRRDFPFDLLLACVSALSAAGLDPIALAHAPEGNRAVTSLPDVFHRSDSLLNPEFVAKNETHSRRIADWREAEGEHLVELVFIGTKPDLQAAAALLSGVDVETAILRNTFYPEYMLEITPRGVSKLSGARALLAHLGLRDDEAIAIGDSDNDYTMLAGLPRSVAVANAEPRILAAAKEITGRNAEGGFGQCVFKHVPEGPADAGIPGAPEPRGPHAPFPPDDSNP